MFVFLLLKVSLHKYNLFQLDKVNFSFKFSKVLAFGTFFEQLVL